MRMPVEADVNLLAISIGNTRVRMGAFVEGKLSDTATFEHAGPEAIGEAIERTFLHMKDRSGAGVLVASVVPRLTDMVVEQVGDRLDHAALLAEVDVPVSIGRQLDPEAIVGVDRLLNAAAAFDVLKQACVIVDAGTAVTVDFVDGAGTFHGGAIMPGCQAMLNAMHGTTAALPALEMAAPKEPMGHNTVEAMRSGVFHAMRGAVRELVEAYAEAAGAFPMVVATGGDANFVYREYELVDRIVPDLTLRGMMVSWRNRLERERERSSGEGG